MEDLVFWLSYGGFSFYLVGSFIGFRNNSLQNVALFGLVCGGVRCFTGKPLTDLFFKK
jgi:hypothetical protein